MREDCVNASRSSCGFVLALLLPLIASPPLSAQPAVKWTGDSPYRLLVEVPPVKLSGRKVDELPAEVKIDFVAQLAKLGSKQRPDLTTLQVIEFDPATGEPRKYDNYAFQRSPADRPFRWLDEAIPYDFPEVPAGIVNTKHKLVRQPRIRGGYFLGVEGDWERGRLTWLHTQRADRTSHYAIYFNLLEDGKEPTERPPQGWIGDGLPRYDKNPTQTISAGHARVDVVDWDGDGRLDLVVGEAQGHVTWLKNIGTPKAPRFSFLRLVKDADGVPIDVGYGAAVRVVDWDSDGDDDLLIGTEKNRIVYYENTGNNRDKRLVFRGVLLIDNQPLELPATPLARGQESIFKTDYYPTLEVVDWDGDGDLDLLAGGYITGRIYWYENVGAKKGQPPQLKLRGPLEADGKPLNVGFWCASPTVADFDGDGDLDLVSGNFPMYERGKDARAGLKYYENVGSRTKPELRERPLPSVDKLPPLSLATPRAVDWDGDGDLDLVVSSGANLYLFRNDGTRQKPAFANSPGVIRLPWGPANLSVDQFLDVNGDGRPDLVSNYVVKLRTERGNPWQWDKPVNILPRGENISHPSKIGDDWFWPWLDDFDGDGKMDVLFGTWHGNIWFHRNQSTADRKQFDLIGKKLSLAGGMDLRVGPLDVDPAKSFVALQGARTVFAPADFDRDGQRDLVVGDTFGKVRYFRNVGKGTEPKFSEPVEMGDLKIRLLVSTCDWNRDGWPDVIAGAANGLVRVFLNRGEKAGKQRFEPGFDPKLPPIVQPRVIVVDLNGDGDDDLFLPSGQGSCFVERSFLEHGYAQGGIVGRERKAK